MPEYVCQILRPSQSAKYKVQAEDKGAAANDLQLMLNEGLVVDLPDRPKFAAVDVDGEVFLSRIFVSGIGRYGGIKIPTPSVAFAAKKLEFPEEFFTGDFEGEGVDMPLYSYGKSVTRI